jgi:hypothetical protein
MKPQATKLVESFLATLRPNVVPSARRKLEGPLNGGVAAEVLLKAAKGKGTKVSGGKMGKESLSKSQVDFYQFAKQAQTGVKSGDKPKRKRVEWYDLPCLCGCGQPTKTPRARFLPGHDAKLKSILLKVERDIEPDSTIPDVARPFLMHCKCCGLPITKHPSGLGPICRAGKCKCEERARRMSGEEVDA